MGTDYDDLNVAIQPITTYGATGVSGDGNGNPNRENGGSSYDGGI